MQSRIEQHARRTEQHAELVKGCVEQLGERTSAVKTGTGKLFGTVQSMATGMYQDELVKHALVDYASENFEIASYTVLITAAEEAGEQQIADVCRQIIEDERAMANWLHENLPLVTRQTIQRQKQH